VNEVTATATEATTGKGVRRPDRGAREPRSATAARDTPFSTNVHAAGMGSRCRPYEPALISTCICRTG